MTNVTTGTVRTLMRIDGTPASQGGGEWSVEAVVNNDKIRLAQVTFATGYGDGRIGVTFMSDQAQAFAEAITAAVGVRLAPTKATRAPAPAPEPVVAAAAVVIADRECAKCGKTIPTSSMGRPARYCSAACRQAAYRERISVTT